jgi:hypothetical protein
LRRCLCRMKGGRSSVRLVAPGPFREGCFGTFDLEFEVYSDLEPAEVESSPDPTRTSRPVLGKQARILSSMGLHRLNSEQMKSKNLRSEPDRFLLLVSGPDVGLGAQSRSRFKRSELDNESPSPSCPLREARPCCPSSSACELESTVPELSERVRGRPTQ